MFCENCAYKNKCRSRKEDATLVGCTSGKPPNVTTNADRIRSMTNKDLAVFLENIETDEVSGATYIEGINEKPLYDNKDFMEWLENEASE